MRKKKLIINSIFGVGLVFINILTTFVVRMFFVRILGYELLGLNALLSTIIATICVVELGIGGAIVFSLYKPIAENDLEKQAALIRLYRKLYFIIAGIILIIGILMIPLLSAITQNTFSLLEILPLYAILLGSSAFSYLFSFNHTILSADQKNYVINIFSGTFRLLTSIAQVTILILTANLFLFLVIGFISMISMNILLWQYVRKKYPHIKNAHYTLEKKELKEIKTKIMALLYHRIGNFFMGAIDNIVISVVFGVIIVGYFSNYLMITQNIGLLFAGFFTGVTASLGNIVATEKREYTMQAVKNIRFLSFSLYSIAVTGIFVLSTQFLTLWLNSETVLPMHFVIILCLNLFIIGYSEAYGNVRFAAGIFEPDKYLHLIFPVINLGLSFVLAFWLGIGPTGVLLATTACLLVKNVLVLPHICHKYVIGGS